MANQSPQNRPNGNNNNDNRNGDRRRFSILTIVIIAVAVTLLFNSLLSNVFSAGEKQVTYNAFLSAVETDAISQVEIQSDRIQFLRRDEMALPKSQRTVYYTGLLPNVDLTSLISTLEDNQVEFSGEIVENSTFTFLFSWVLFPLLMLALLSLLMRFIISRSGGGAGGFGAIGSIGKSKAKVYMEKETGVTFRDVAGQDEAKESLVEIIDFLHNPQKYAAIGAKLPKGALLVGSPGTGKTLLAKAVAGEARVPFFSISGSDFVEMFVGVGASRVRDLFQEASKVAPAIIFIDEIDAIGRSRDSRLGGNDEREQTLNQLLAEIDGFDSSKGVVILAATNRPEILDKALLRAGRFDRRIIVDRPNLEGRYQTLLVHTRNIRLAEDVDLKKIAQATAGAVGADLANLVNEAALRAVRMGRQTVNQEDLLTSFEVVIAGTEKKGTVLTDIEKRIVAYHEVGHALVAALQKHTQPVSKITIVPHTSGALGYTMQMPEEEKYLNSRDELLVELRTMLGGRAAEQTVFGIETTGASNDIERATDLARKMVMQYGMSDRIGLMALTTKGNEYLDGQSYTDCAQTTAAAADEEVRKLLNDSYDQAKKILTENRGLLDEVALYLLQKETITGDELMQYVDADKRLRGSKQETLPEAEA
ncbi:ATP-dependent zinc metalloprotease FtsH [Faecousia sp.]|jgi:cell division protease FtsH|uniref:ATP-dependent zinc metalloprotease FtsH n=1 Tax=Faecousia sp. TaxID=2952921 RepID=UPI002A9615EB|nr:ATP-dependent zinc metalloprotease FtsH [Candidatus Faecousia sp.]